jgi:hypothetical protein
LRCANSEGLRACVDFSAVKGGSLVAYRWDGETQIQTDHTFVAYLHRWILASRPSRTLAKEILIQQHFEQWILNIDVDRRIALNTGDLIYRCQNQLADSALVGLVRLQPFKACIGIAIENR